MTWRICESCGTLARESHFPQRCPMCGAASRVASADEIEARRPCTRITVAVSIHGRREAARGSD
jgi:hypothetical protein